MLDPLILDRQQILAFRRRVGALDERLLAGSDALRLAGWAGLQDSMPRAAVLSLHARVRGIEPQVLIDPSLSQVWGPRYSVYVVAERDAAVFTLGRWPDDPARQQRATVLADRLRAILNGERVPYGEVGERLRLNPNSLRYATTTGTVRIRWDGARQPLVWTVPAPQIDPAEARQELARRYLHIWGPGTHARFAEWAGVSQTSAAATFHALRRSLVPVRTPVGQAVILSDDEDALRAAPGADQGARLLPSGDAYYLLQGDERALLVPDATRRGELWTSRVWPGAVLLGGELRGTWRRAGHVVTVTPWERLSAAGREAIEAEALALPLAGLGRAITVRWDARF